MDKGLPEQERSQLQQHLLDCEACSRESERFERVRRALRALPKSMVPAELTLRLRVAASRVRAESMRAKSGWFDRLELIAKNLMRPLALPLAGGVFSAVVLFGTLVPTFTSTYAMSKAAPTGWDVPTMLNTEPSVMCTAPVVFPEADAIVDLTIDEQGRMVNYKIVSIAPGQKIDQLRPIIENQLLFTSFRAATAFGKPISSTVRVSFGSSHVDVRG